MRRKEMELFKSIVTNVLTALYQTFGLRYSLRYSSCFLYVCISDNRYRQRNQSRLPCPDPNLTQPQSVAKSPFRCNGGWWIWNTQPDGTVTLTTECFENIALMLPFTFLLMWTAKEKLLKGRRICFTG